MEFKQLEMLVAVAEERSVMRAAERVFRSQPAVSMALARLEQELGSRLFHRSRHRRFELTAAGELLCQYARRMLALRDEVSRLVTEEVVLCPKLRQVASRA